MKLIYLILRVFLAWTFLNFLAHSGLLGVLDLAMLTLTLQFLLTYLGNAYFSNVYANFSMLKYAPNKSINYANFCAPNRLSL